MPLRYAQKKKRPKNREIYFSRNSGPNFSNRTKFSFQFNFNPYPTMKHQLFLDLSFHKGLK